MKKKKREEIKIEVEIGSNLYKLLDSMATSEQILSALKIIFNKKNIVEFIKEKKK